jgi:hypothetical protein
MSGMKNIQLIFLVKVKKYRVREESSKLGRYTSYTKRTVQRGKNSNNKDNIFRHKDGSINI